ncbi:MAG: hypothetical protein BGO01_02210 [Armatimonadetes bacterium 55-13]|nr:MarR family transcriptional regulator [Armatimonadota bacterium]OJU65742.1 MAG: hypothetical protein BGO01_02210 [Armatimonadetes bacterium 55-13]
METTKDQQQIQDLPIAAYVKLIRSAEALHAEVSRGLASEGLTASQFSALKVLRLRGPLAQRDIANYLVKTGGNITVVVDNLEHRNLVVRIRDTEDRRIVFVKLTPEGEQIFDRVYGPHLDRIRGVMSALSDKSLNQLTELLEELYPSPAEPLCYGRSEEADKPKKKGRTPSAAY